MASIQNTFSFTPSTDQFTPDSVTIEVVFPKYAFRILENVTERFVSDHIRFNIVHDPEEDNYRLHMPLPELVGSDIQNIYGFFLYHFIEIINTRSDINQFAVPFTVYLKDSQGQEINSQSFEGLFLQKKSQSSDYDRLNYEREYSDYERTYGPVDQFNAVGLSRLSHERDRRVYFINKEVYERLKYVLTGGNVLSSDHPDQLVLDLIDLMTDISQGYPKPVAADNLLSFMQLSDLFRGRQLNMTEESLSYLQENLALLFDFPLELPALETITVNGNLEIISEETLSKSDLDFYDLTLEFAMKNNSPQIFRYKWATSSNEITGNKIDFEFEGENGIIVNNISGRISISVKGFDGSVLWQESYDPSDTELQNVIIQLNEYPGGPIEIDSTTGKPLTGKRLRGKVIQEGSNFSLNDLTVLIQAKKAGDELFKIISATQTDSSGNFSMNYPYGDYREAQALVSVMPDSPADLEILGDRDNEAIADDFIYLMLRGELPADVEEDGHSGEHDCECQEPKKAKRLPDQTDLIESDEYTQDIGGSCINLSTPNRTLREYSYNAIVRTSDPDVANYVLEKNASDDNVKYDLVGGTHKLERGVVDLDNPIRWEDAPDARDNLSLYQAVTVATGHILHFKSQFKADGYSLGDLVYSLPLAPGQKKQIVVFESSHSLTGAESQSISQGESLSAELVSDRFITDQLSGGINEATSGRSKAHTSGMSAGLGIGVSYGGIGGSLGVAGGFSNSKSSASQNSSRNISQFFGEKLRQSLIQNAESFRQLNASVVTTVTEGQEYGVTSEVVANHNHCHSLTMMYFEVLRHYAIFQEISHVEECVFVPLLLTHFSAENIHKWKDVLAQNLLPVPSNTYLKGRNYSFRGLRQRHPLVKGFDANERIKTDYDRVDFPTGTYAEEDINQISGEFTLRVKLDRPKTRYDRILSFPKVTRTVEHKELDPVATAKAWFNPFDWNKTKYRTTQETLIENARIFDSFMQLDADFQTKKPADCIRVINFEPVDVTTTDADNNSINITVSGSDFFEGDVVDRNLWTKYSQILGYSSVYSMLNNYFRGALISEWDNIFRNQMLPEIFENIVETIRIERLSWDLNNTTDYKGGERRIRIRITSGSYSGARNSLPDMLRIASNNPIVRSLDSGFVRLDIENVRINYTTDHFQGVLFSGYKGDDLLDGVELAIPLTARDKRNPKKEDAYIVNELIEHLNSNIEHYNKILWANLDPDRRFMLLDGFNIQTYTSTGHKSNMRSLASVVKNELISIAGNSLVFPVANGYKVGRNSMLEEIDDNVFVETSLLDYYKPLTPMQPYRLSVPTRGVFMEAIQGNCDACEMVKENSSQDWDKFRTEEPTPIAPVVTPTPTISEYRPEYQEFAPPMVNIQNAPDAPAPAAGLNQLSELLGKSGVFNDVTGLAGNQENVMRTYLSNQENAKAFAEMAKSLATQQHNTQNSQGIADGITEARRSGAISDDDAQELTRQHLQQQIDGGEAARETAQFDREQQRPSLSEVAADAANRGQAVQAQRTDADGTHESIALGSEGEERVSLIYATVPLIAQPNKHSCWAASMAMLVSHQRTLENNSESTVTPNDIAAGIGISLASSFPLSAIFPAKEEYRLNDLPYTGNNQISARQWHTWIEQFGPLWIGVGEDPYLHAIVVYGIEGDLDSDNVILHIHDPWDTSTSFDEDPIDFNPENSGRTHTQSVENINQRLATSGLPSDWRILYAQVNEPDPDMIGPPGQSGWMSGVPTGRSMTQVKRALWTLCDSEYSFWHSNPDPNPAGQPGPTRVGNVYWERDPDPARERLIQYWLRTYDTNLEGLVPTGTPARDRAYAEAAIDRITPSLTAAQRTAMLSAEGLLTGQRAWSAAFISYIVAQAGFTSNDVFPCSGRHVDYIANAIRNKEGNRLNNPFWGYRIGDYTPVKGDMVCRSPQANYDNVLNRSNNEVWRRSSHVDIVTDKQWHETDESRRYIVAIGGNVECNRIYLPPGDPTGVSTETPANILNVSVGKRKIYLDADGKIDLTKNFEIFDGAGTVQYRRPQSDYFCVIKVRTNRSSP